MSRPFLRVPKNVCKSLRKWIYMFGKEVSALPKSTRLASQLYAAYGGSRDGRVKTAVNLSRTRMDPYAIPAE